MAGSGAKLLRANRAGVWGPKGKGKAKQKGKAKRKQTDEDDDDDEDDRDEREEIRKAALEFMVSLSEAKPNMVRRIDGWVGALVRCCLDGMGELDDSPEELNSWLNADVSAR